jgi:hypothetical protein
MSNNCNTGISIPTLLPTEPCGGNYISTNCVASPNANSELDLPIGATQTQTNAAITAALLHKEEQIQSIITDISNIPQTDGSETKLTAGDNIDITGAGTDDTPYIINSIVKLTTDISIPTALLEGKMRYYSDTNNSYVDVVMKTGTSTYAWVNLVQNNWV